MFSLRLAGAPALGSSVGSGVALGAAVAAGFSVAGGRVLRPVVGRSGGFSQSMYQAATAQASASTQQTMTVAILAARPMRRRAVFCFFRGSPLPGRLFRRMRAGVVAVYLHRKPLSL